MKKQKCKCYCHKDMNTVVTARECINKECENVQPSEEKEHICHPKGHFFDVLPVDKSKTAIEKRGGEYKKFTGDITKTAREVAKSEEKEGCQSGSCEICEVDLTCEWWHMSRIHNMPIGWWKDDKKELEYHLGYLLDNLLKGEREKTKQLLLERMPEKPEDEKWIKKGNFVDGYSEALDDVEQYIEKLFEGKEGK